MSYEVEFRKEAQQDIIEAIKGINPRASPGP